jgi:hypothetical protein
MKHLLFLNPLSFPRPTVFHTTPNSSRPDSLSVCLGQIGCCSPLPPLHACLWPHGHIDTSSLPRDVIDCMYLRPPYLPVQLTSPATLTGFSQCLMLRASRNCTLTSHDDKAGAWAWLPGCQAAHPHYTAWSTRRRFFVPF